MPSTKREIPHGFFAALNHLGGTIILLFSGTLELVVMLIFRCSKRLGGSPSEPVEKAATTPVKRKSRAMKAVEPKYVDQEFELAMANAARANGLPVCTTRPNMAFAGSAPMGAPAPQPTPPAPPAREPPSRKPPEPPRPAEPPVIPEAPRAQVQGPEDPAEQSHTGVIVWAGIKQHFRQGRPYECFTVILRDGMGTESVHQGKELEGAMQSVGAQPGNRVTLTKKGRSYVGGQGAQKFFRNNWIVTRQ